MTWPPPSTGRPGASAVQGLVGMFVIVVLLSVLVQGLLWVAGWAGALSWRESTAAAGFYLVLRSIDVAAFSGDRRRGL